MMVTNNMSWNTNSFPMAAPKEQVSASDLANLLKGRRFGQTQASGVDMCPSVEQFNPDDMKELEEYCKKRGIIGVNFTGMNPKAVLRMLRARVEGVHSESTKRTVLNG